MRSKDYYLSAEYRELQERNKEFPNMGDDDDRMKRDRDDDYSYEPSDAIIGGIERSLKRKLKDKTHK